MHSDAIGSDSSTASAFDVTQTDKQSDEPVLEDSQSAPNHIKIRYINKGGMRSTLSDFYNALQSCDYDVVVVVESWLHFEISDAELTPPGWTLALHDRAVYVCAATNNLQHHMIESVKISVIPTRWQCSQI